MKTAIVYGGFSSERKASEENARYIEKTLKKCGYETCMVPYEKNLIDTLRREQAEMVYVCVQGKGHGDGTIQAMLEHEGIPFTGSRAHAASLINDKIVSKLLFEHARISTPRWQMLTKEEYEAGKFDAEAFGYPFVAKAPSEGGSFGIVLIREEKELDQIRKVFAYESPILIEEFIAGEFYTIGLFERERLTALPCVRGLEVIEGKEKEETDRLQVFTGEYAVRKADLPKELLDRMKEMAKKAFALMGAQDIARVDFMVSAKDLQPYMLEINAVPGLKPRSLLPQAAGMAGISYEELIEGILLSAWKKRMGER